MALVVATLQSALESLFTGMQGENKTDEYLADGISDAIKDFIATGTITTVDTAAAVTSPGPYIGGSFVGTGTGSLEVDPDDCSSIIQDACAAMRDDESNDDDFFAGKIAEAIDTMVSGGTVTCNITGTVTIPGSPPVVIPGVAGTSTGQVAGVPAPIEAGLKVCFASMQNMSEGGDALFAAQLASLVNAYLLAGVVTTDADAASLLVPVKGTGAML